MERNSGLRKALQFPSVYDVVQGIIGATRHRTKVIESLEVPDGALVVEVGCGLGKLLDVLGNVRFVGFDINERYIASAQTRYTGRDNCEFFVADASDGRLRERIAGCDYIFSLGVLHHLTDEQNDEVLSMAADAIKKKGRCILYEPFFPKQQSRIGAFFMKLDRGTNIKTRDGWIELAKKHFKKVNVKIHSPVYLLRYSILVMECCNED